MAVKEERDCLGGRSGRVFRSAIVGEAEVSVKESATVWDSEVAVKEERDCLGGRSGRDF